MIHEWDPVQPIAVEADSTSRDFFTQSGAHIGVIAPVTESFCSTCSRWRLSSEGVLRACLMAKTGISLRHKSPQEIIQDMKG
jgi:cyclic pyranopterin phosphate synthase